MTCGRRRLPEERAGDGVQARDLLDGRLQLVQRAAQRPGHLGVAVAGDVGEVIGDEGAQDRVVLLALVELQQQALLDAAGADAGRLQALHGAQGLLGLLHGHGRVHAGDDLFERVFQVAAPVEVGDQLLADAADGGVQLVVGKLLVQVHLQGDVGRGRVLQGRQLGVPLPAGIGGAVFAAEVLVVGGPEHVVQRLVVLGLHGVAVGLGLGLLGEDLDGVRLFPVGGLGLGLLGRLLGGALLGGRGDLQEGVLQQLLVDALAQLQQGKLQYLYGLDDLRCQLQPHLLARLQAGFKSHARLTCVYGSLAVQPFISRRPSRASARMEAFAYSRWLPLGMPRASRLTITGSPSSASRT